MSKRNMRHSREQEHRIARLLGGRRHAYSGSRPEQDGDGHVGEDASSLDYILLECKRTNGTEQITIKRKDLDKHTHEARQVGREPVLAFELDKDYAIIDIHYLAQLLDATRPEPSPENCGCSGWFGLHDEDCTDEE